MEDYDFEDKSEEEILFSFTANKEHRTRQFKKITNLLALQEQKYSKATEKPLLQAVTAIERYQDHLTLLASYLNLHTLQSVEVHATEAETLATETETLVDKVITQVHNHEPNEAVIFQVQQAQMQLPQHNAAKPVMALKPEKLTFNANLGTVRRWKQRFRAFHASSNLRVLPLTDQQAFLIACIEHEVANRIHRLVSETTQILPSGRYR